MLVTEAELYDGSFDLLSQNRTDLGRLSKSLAETATRAALKLHEPQHGTTCVSFIYKGGVMMATDSRASAGSEIMNDNIVKLIQVNDTIAATMAGGAADCQFCCRYLGYQISLWEAQYKTKCSVRVAATLLSSLYAYLRRKGVKYLSASNQIGGFSGDEPDLYLVDDDGSCRQRLCQATGSGSLYAFGLIKAEWKHDLSEEEALKLAASSIYRAGLRDPYSGNHVNIWKLERNNLSKIESLTPFADIYTKYLVN